MLVSKWLYWCDPGEWWYLLKTLLMWLWQLVASEDTDEDDDPKDYDDHDDPDGLDDPDDLDDPDSDDTDDYEYNVETFF